MQIENLDSKDKVIIVAEIGNNHEGSFSLAKKFPLFPLSYHTIFIVIVSILLLSLFDNDELY